MKNNRENGHPLLVPAILLLSAVGALTAYSGMFSNALVWDDLAYLLEYPQSSMPVFARLPDLFSTNEFFLGNYHPLTIFSYRIDFSLAQQGYWPHRMTSLVLHMANSFLVFLVVARFLAQAGYRRGLCMASALVALLFAIHPLHVESVAWLAGRKDVLYTFFYLISVYAYISYVRSYRYRYYATSLLCFLLALTAKAMAAVLPVTLILIDYVSWRNMLKRRLVIEKIPFILIAVYFGLLAIDAQATARALSDKSAYALWERALLILYSPGHYILKTIIPTGLSVFYPYPFAPGGTPTPATWAGAGITLAALALALFFVRSHRILSFSILFFFANIIMVLQFIPVGNAPVADRYHYMAGIGLLLPFAYAYIKLLHNVKWKNIFIISIIIISSIFSYISQKRVAVWANHISLWSDVIGKHPNVSSAWLSRGSEYYNRGQYLKAQSDLNEALKINPSYVLAYNNRGLVFTATSRYDRAILDFSRALRIKASPQLYYNRSLSYARAGMKERALADLDSCLMLSPGLEKALARRAALLSRLGEYEKALSDYNYLINKQADYQMLAQRASILARAGRYKEAIKDMDRAIKQNPALPALWFNRGNILGRAGKSREAIDSYNKAIAMDPGMVRAWVNRANEMNKLGQYEEVIRDMDLLAGKGMAGSFPYLHRGWALAGLGQTEEACKDFEKARQMGNPKAKEMISKWCAQ
jgi:tetratricopeptide (TPR) repeat protein